MGAMIRQMFILVTTSCLLFTAHASSKTWCSLKEEFPINTAVKLHPYPEDQHAPGDGIDATVFDYARDKMVIRFPCSLFGTMLKAASVSYKRDIGYILTIPVIRYSDSKYNEYEKYVLKHTRKVTGTPGMMEAAFNEEPYSGLSSPSREETTESSREERKRGSP